MYSWNSRALPESSHRHGALVVLRLGGGAVGADVSVDVVRDSNPAERVPAGGGPRPRETVVEGSELPSCAPARAAEVVQDAAAGVLARICGYGEL